MSENGLLTVIISHSRANRMSEKKKVVFILSGETILAEIEFLVAI